MGVKTTKYWIKNHDNIYWAEPKDYSTGLEQKLLDKGWKEITKEQYDRHKRKEKLKEKAKQGAFGLNYVNSTIRLFENVVRDQDNNELLLAKLELIEEDLINNNQLWANDEKFLFSDKTLPWILEIKALMTPQQKALVDINIEIVNDELPTLPISILDADNKYHAKLGYDPKNPDDTSAEVLPHSPTPKPKYHDWVHIGDITEIFDKKINIEHYKELKLQYTLNGDASYSVKNVNKKIQLPAIALNPLEHGKEYELGIAIIDASHESLNHDYSAISYKLNNNNEFVLINKADNLIGGMITKINVWCK